MLDSEQAERLFIDSQTGIEWNERVVGASKRDEKY